MMDNCCTTYYLFSKKFQKVTIEHDYNLSSNSDCGSDNRFVLSCIRFIVDKKSSVEIRMWVIMMLTRQKE